ncbi:MAG: 50S ribosomal protein L28 [Candidatus Omnitrophica bacterium]|nr:50S ribosomal protein L28 [Candidatus Omnitrophota bacterium]MDE2010137.1 50S ribosomal protein L28 [Candidatus Omnitrophota bacterium]MDE2214324.1 50S ribosomal protein L28 [Candidatus Omnitrophota bacterium]MDE2231073.1 50S ribosomal protein L28 [Candidatus Omnitrophota bacterium]
MRTCVICAKSPASGRKYKRRGMEKKKGGAGSKIVGKSFRAVLPNLQRIKIKLNGVVQRALVCTGCIKANKVTRAA